MGYPVFRKDLDKEIERDDIPGSHPALPAESLMLVKVGFAPVLPTPPGCAACCSAGSLQEILSGR